MQVDAVVNRLIAAIQRTVEVEHRGVALIHVLGGELEHVVVEPMRTHSFAPVARNLGDAAASVRCPSPDVRRGGVDRRETCQHDRPVIIVELTGEEERPGETVVLRAVVAVVLVGADGMPAEPVVLGRLKRQQIAMAKHDRLAVTAKNQLRRHRAVERPH